MIPDEPLAQITPLYRVLGIAVDVAHLAVAQVHADAERHAHMYRWSS